MGAELVRVFSGAGAACGLSVAYLAGSDQLADPGDYVREWNASSVGWTEGGAPEASEVAPSDVIAARSLRGGDPSFTRRGVLLGVHGIHLPEQTDTDAGLESYVLHSEVPWSGDG